MNAVFPFFCRLLRLPRAASRIVPASLGAALVVAGLSAGLPGGVSGARAEPVSVTDARGHAVEIADSSRVVSVGGSITEILYGLGLEDRIVAVDTTSLYPAEALAEKPNVGYLRALSPEGVLSTDPSLILAEADAGPPEAVELLETASVPFVSAPGGTDPEGVAEKIRFVAKVMSVPEAGEDMAKAVAQDLKTVREAVDGLQDRRRVLFVLSLSNGRIMAAGDGTSAAAMIEMAGADNALTGFTGYKPVNDEAVIEAAPDVIVMMARGDHAAAADEVFAHPALATTPAADGPHLVTMDGLYLLGFGPRVAQAVRDLSHAIYPDAPIPELPERPWAAASGGAAGQ
ncbi:heme/hemin ABC transporter substrate-binding protein [Microbaculum marinum]|uniref:ABC transporter substrate-binding protein n=1 Tax=Microbaculum marinum TaxID=1764581 RepID=A0AAW9RYU6_9HYPH